MHVVIVRCFKHYPTVWAVHHRPVGLHFRSAYDSPVLWKVPSSRSNYTMLVPNLYHISPAMAGTGGTIQIIAPENTLCCFSVENGVSFVSVAQVG